jgi:hypothetical protein
LAAFLLGVIVNAGGPIYVLMLINGPMGRAPSWGGTVNVKP